MKKQDLSFTETNRFSDIFTDFITGNESLQPFYGKPASLNAFKEQLDLKKAVFTAEKRKALTEHLKAQYTRAGLPLDGLDLLLDENTFTLTTGHQLNLATGPLYFHYKILTVIRAAETLKEAFPEYNFMPVYWAASEDHDIDEIRFFNLFGKKITWETEQQGPVGHFSNEGIPDILRALNDNTEPLLSAYENSETLSEATQKIVYSLYAKHGLIVLDADSARLKQEFTEIMKTELTEHPSRKAILKSSENLEQKGYKAQIYPREINLFFIENGRRERIEKDGSIYRLTESRDQFSEEEIFRLLEEKPECFSPNVALRPLYQEVVLPNLSYTGGPGELAYWLQLKGVFDHFEVPFPILLPRKFLLYISPATSERIKKLDVSITELFTEFKNLKKPYLERISGTEINLSEEKKQLNDIFEHLAEKVKQVDNSLLGAVGQQKKGVFKSFAQFEKRIRKTEEQRHETALKQLEKLQDKLFPGGGLQERYDNFLNFYINDKDFLNKIYEQLDPFDFRFMVLIEEKVKEAAGV